ncbi:hydrolase [Meridianimarinicoccus roseus]|jgi:putative hydrolase of HD superfamily|uniref:Hydrolase n=1 Tax=Meridianimarinicoccus roseus TaxID=2072018 RepID=A0A2V2LK28_9RHOB|nr:HD domain-containing protein [Meridianimarinicoccus roseus]PWR03477.1 hydrolase [Meridianimarinicoccus roseus]
MTGLPDRLDRQLDFLVEIDKLKTITRASPIADGTRKENSGEHSWHLAMFALVLADQAEPGVSIDRVIRMLLIHDIVEIDAGDTPIHGAGAGSTDQAEAEARAADRLFGLLPDDQAAHLRALWEEFEAAETADARFAKALDRCQPPLLNMASGGGSWTDYAVTLDHIDARVGKPAARGAPVLWQRVRARILPFFTAD